MLLVQRAEDHSMICMIPEQQTTSGDIFQTITRQNLFPSTALDATGSSCPRCLPKPVKETLCTYLGSVLWRSCWQTAHPWYILENGTCLVGWEESSAFTTLLQMLGSDGFINDTFLAKQMGYTVQEEWSCSPIPRVQAGFFYPLSQPICPFPFVKHIFENEQVLTVLKLGLLSWGPACTDGRFRSSTSEVTSFWSRPFVPSECCMIATYKESLPQLSS